MSRPKEILQIPKEVRIPSGRVQLEGELYIPHGARGIVLFAHGSGSSRHSPRNKYVQRGSSMRPTGSRDNPEPKPSA
jgi:hypothetical protein